MGYKKGKNEASNKDVDSLLKIKKRTKRQNSNNYSTKIEEDLVPFPSLNNIDESKRENAFIDKLRQCRRNFDFSDATCDIKNKEIKRCALNDMIDFFTTHKGVLTERVYFELSKMVAANIFRPLPPYEIINECDTEDDDPMQELAWPHLSLVYDLLQRVLESREFDPQIAKRFFDDKFIINLLDLFDSQDMREREMLKTILHRIYGKLLGYRAFIRRRIKYIFLKYAFEDSSFHGISELLEILYSIINGFALPLKEEHVQFLIKVLIPLHRPRNIYLYHDNLCLCIIQFIEKDQKLAIPVVNGIIKLWPKTNSSKELSLLNELESIIEKCVHEPEVFKDINKPFFLHLAKCISCTHFQVAEKALYLWNNELLLSYIEEHNEVVMNIMFPYLYKVSKEHWNQTIIQLVYQVLRTLMHMNEPLFNRLVDNYKINKEQAVVKDAERLKKWQDIESLANQVHRG